MCRIGALPEGVEPDAAHGVDEAFTFRTHRPVHLDDALDGGGALVLAHRRADHLTECGEAVGRAAETDLVPLLAVLIDTEYADVPDMVMAAGIHAAGHLDLKLAQVVEVVEVIEALLDRLGDIERGGGGERAAIT